MTERRTADTITDDELDQLYARIETLESVAAGNKRHVQLIVPDLERAEATLARVRALRDDLHNITGARYIADALDAILDGKQAATQATRPATWLLAGTRDLAIPEQHRYTLDPEEEHAATERARHIADEAVRQMDADPHGLEAGMIVKAYREHGAEKWVFRCWGTDTCDGWLSLDHSSQKSAERARDRHVAEDHPATPGPCPACRRADQAGLAPAEQHDDCAKEQQ